MDGINPGRGIERRKEKKGVKRPEGKRSEEEVRRPEGEIGITIEIGDGGVKITIPREALYKILKEGGRVVIRTPKGIIELEPSEEFSKKVKEHQEEVKRYQETTEKAEKALEETLTQKLEGTPGIPPELLEEVKKIFEDVIAHLPEIPEILKKLEEELSKLKEELAQTPEEQRRKLENAIRGLKIAIEYLTRLQKIAGQINIREIERLKDEGFVQAIKEIAELFSILKQNIDEGLAQIFPDKGEKVKEKVKQGQISHAINLIAGGILRRWGEKGIRVDEILLEHWVKPLITGIAWYIVDRVLKDYEEKLSKELENLEQQFIQAGQDDQKLRELLRDLYERIEGESKNKLLKGLGIQKDGFDQFLEALLEIKNKELARSKLRYLIISALGIRAREEIFKEINKKVKEIAEVVYDKLRNFSTQQTETPSGPVTGSRGEAISTIVVNKLLTTLERKLEGNKMSKEELMDILGKLFIILSEEEMNKFGSNLEEFINKLKTLLEKSEEEDLRLVKEFFGAIERKTGRGLSDEIVEKICKILFASK